MTSEVELLRFERSFIYARIERAARMLRWEAMWNVASQHDLVMLANDLDQIKADAKSAAPRWKERKP